MEKQRHLIDDFFLYCKVERNVSIKTIKAYKADLNQFYTLLVDMKVNHINDVSKQHIRQYLLFLNEQYKPRSVKRKLAAVKHFFNFLTNEEYLNTSPFQTLNYKLNAPIELPKTIPNEGIAKIIEYLSTRDTRKYTNYELFKHYRTVALIEVLISTGMRVSEISNLKRSDINYLERFIKIYGKGSKERIIYISCEQTINALKTCEAYSVKYRGTSDYFFLSKFQARLTEQTIRHCVRDLGKKFGYKITPHMFRHTFATMLLEDDVDLIYIQKLLGHHSVSVTQIYTRASKRKQKEILENKNPRLKF